MSDETSNQEAVEIILPLRAIKAASHYISKDEQRYVLNGVHLCKVREQCLVIATDGRQMVFIDVTAEAKGWPEDLQLTIKPEHILLMHSTFGTSTDLMTITDLEERKVRVTGMIGGHLVPAWEIMAERADVSGRYPSWWEIPPAPCPEEKLRRTSICLDAERVNLIAKSFRDWTRADSMVEIHMHPEEEDAFTVTSQCRTIMAVLCKLRMTPGDRLPAFIQDAVAIKKGGKLQS